VILGIEGNRQFIGSFVIPNEEISSTPLEDFQVSLSTIQHHTGLEFFNKIKRHESLCHKVDCILKNK
jgi:DNA/RNA endonuclease G (NUC1)